MTPNFDGWTPEEIRDWILESVNEALGEISYNLPEERQYLVSNIQELIQGLINIYDL